MCSKPKTPPPAPRYQGGHAPTYSETGSKTGRTSTILTGGDGVRKPRGSAETAAAGTTGGRDAAMLPTMALVKKTLLGV